MDRLLTSPAKFGVYASLSLQRPRPTAACRTSSERVTLARSGRAVFITSGSDGGPVTLQATLQTTRGQALYELGR